MKQIYALMVAFAIVFSVSAQNKDIKTKIRSEQQSPLPENMKPQLSIQKELLGVPAEFKLSSTGFQPKANISLKNMVEVNGTDTSLFTTPAGFFRAGYSLEFYAYDFYFLLGPAYADVSWRNLSTDGITMFNYTLPDPNQTTYDEYSYVSSTITSTDENPTMSYPFDAYYSNPVLEGTNEGFETTSYAYGGEDSVVLFTGAHFSDYWLVAGFPACNYEIQKSYSYFDASVSSDIYAIAEYVEKPAQKYLLDSLWFSAYLCTAKTGTEFECVIYSIDDEGYIADTLATSTIGIEDLYGPLYQTYYYHLIFSEFDVYNDELGFDVTQDYLEIEDAVFVELKGVNQSGVTYYGLMQYNEHESGINNAYVLFDEDDPSFGWWGINTSNLLNLNLSFSFLYADDYEFAAEAAASSKTFTLRSGYPVDEVALDGTLPDWLSVEKSYNADGDELYLTFTTSDLPDGTSERSEVLTYYVNETYAEFTITQSITNGVAMNPESDVISVVKQQGALAVEYPSAYNTLNVFDLSGRVCGTYALPTNGSYTFTPELKAKSGVYILMFSGNGKNKTVKINY